MRQGLSRRDFMRRTSAGFLAAAVRPGEWAIAAQPDPTEPVPFKRYRPGQSLCPIVQVTPGDAPYCHTYYDICPFSPSGRHLAVTRFPYQNRKPGYGVKAEVCLIDLEKQRIRRLYSTVAWGYQLGANVQWGPDDRYLYTNDVIDGEAVCVRIDLETGEIRGFAGPKYDIAPDGSTVISPRLELMSRTQKGYGVPRNPDDPTTPLPKGAAEDEGIWHTELNSNRRSLLVSLADVAAHASDPPEFYKDGTFYFWHCKYNPEGSHVMQVLRCLIPGRGGWNPSLFTFEADGSGIRQIVKRQEWAEGGHHPNWHPDGKQILMNLTPRWDGEDEMRFCLIPRDGGDIRILSRKIRGGGHPRIHPRKQHYLIGDAYPREPVATKEGEVPIRLIDLDAEDERHICTIFTDLRRRYGDGPERKVDPHPEWSRDGLRVCFNGAPTGVRQVFIAELDSLLS